LLSQPAWKVLAAQPSRLARQQTSQTPFPGNHFANCRRNPLSPDSIVESQKSSRYKQKTYDAWRETKIKIPALLFIWKIHMYPRQ
jgi:hypothetical protein